MHDVFVGNLAETEGRPSYGKPRLERLGTFRELTQSGGASFQDLFVSDGNAGGCHMHASNCYNPR